MGWEKIKFNEQEINDAGDILAKEILISEEIDAAFEVLDNWRAVHSYPMHIFQMRLKEKAKDVDKSALIAQRLKRAHSIMYKLRREYGPGRPKIKLYDMQDIGGCRAVLSNVSYIAELSKKLKGEAKHKLVKANDYITKPKEDGYRSLHLIYSFKSDKGMKKYNGLLTEIQIRSRLQHLWATAVETAGFFIKQSIKAHEAEPEWIEFFKLVSSAFAIAENCPRVPKTPVDEKELFLKIKEMALHLNVKNLMNGWTKAMKFFDEEVKAKSKKRFKFFLLKLNISGEELNISSYTQNQLQIATQEYAELEKLYSGKNEYDIVLAGADGISDLKRAYPNYFVDTGEFLKHLDKIISKY